MRARLSLAAMAAALIAGCGGSTKTVTTPAVKVIQQHVCSPADEALQCVLPPAPRTLAAPLHAVHGVDFAWGAPTARSLVRQGYRFGASYLSYDPSKGWTQRPGMVGEYHRAGLGTVAVWETTANRAGQGCSAGASDAVEAARQARALGNTDRPIFFAIDFDATGGQVDGYFRCAHARLGGRVGAYGGYNPLAYLCAHGLVGHANWQTYAWSGGRWLPGSCAPLEQYLNDSSVDYDRAIAADYGQWPAPAKPASNRAAKRRALARERHAITSLHRLIDRHHCRPGDHAAPRRFHTVCGYWLRHGDTHHRNARRLERELRRHQ